MPAKKIKINPNGEALFVNIVFKGLIVASYEYMLFEAQSNHVIERKKGNNQNPDDDKYALPKPASGNVNRLIDIRSNIVGLDPENYKEWEAKAELYQGNTKLDEVVESGETSETLQTSQLFILMIDEPQN
jgi:hypothetical protein